MGISACTASEAALKSPSPASVTARTFIRYLKPPIKLSTTASIGCCLSLSLILSWKDKGDGCVPAPTLTDQSLSRSSSYLEHMHIHCSLNDKDNLFGIQNVSDNC